MPARSPRREISVWKLSPEAFTLLMMHLVCWLDMFTGYGESLWDFASSRRCPMGRR